MIIQIQCMVKCVEESDCESVIIKSMNTTAPKRCDFYRLQCLGLAGSDEEKWNRVTASCSKGFSRFGTTNSCYRIYGDDCTWTGHWQEAENACNTYGPSVHLAGMKLNTRKSCSFGLWLFLMS